MALIKQFRKDSLSVQIYSTRKEMGKAVAHDMAAYLRELLSAQSEVNIIFAAAPSQDDFLEALLDEKDIDWRRVNVFHMDEYIGIDIRKRQSFSRFVKESVVDKFPVKAFFPVNGMADSPEEECLRYSRILEEYPPDIVCLGIGENGHIAFNDPQEADFNDGKAVKVVHLDDVCRLQQVHDKLFDTIGDVPKLAITLTIPTLLKAKAMFCTVPGKTKAAATERTLNGGIGTECPASVLRTHKKAYFYCDADSGEQIIGSAYGTCPETAV